MLKQTRRSPDVAVNLESTSTSRTINVDFVMIVAGMGIFYQRLKRTTRQPIATFARLERIGRCSDCNGAIRSLPQFLPKDFDKVDLHVDLAVEACPYIAIHLGVVRAGETVTTTMCTTLVGIKAPVEGHTLDAVQRARTLNFTKHNVVHLRRRRLRVN
ncbi:MAG: hypothetical protein E6J35_05740 [Chloroflexi bacterium]|nr:MAG: hypothetical protein E6J35_05740 [Chloroflexota bacterium]